APSPADLKPTVAEQRVAQAPPQRAQPQRVEPAPSPAATGSSNKNWLIAGGVAVALVVALIAILVGAGSGDDSPQARISAAIGDYTGALESGDLPALRNITCGALHDYYQGLSEEQFAGVHRQAVSEGSIPEVTGVDAVKITDRTALAQVTVQTDAEETTRTFDLQETDSGWKVCDPPAGAR
ncbi:Rv0361 family membrane protein, partial [Nocardia speluncae]